MSESSTPAAAAPARHYLVVAYQTLGRRELTDALHERTAAGPADFWFVVPATHLVELAPLPPPMPTMGGVASIPDPEHDRAVAQGRLDTALQQLAAHGVQAGGEVGDADPVRAVKAALRSRQVDEIIVATLPEHLSKWLRQDLPHRLEHHFHVPVTHVASTA
jgi:GABA permease